MSCWMMMLMIIIISYLLPVIETIPTIRQRECQSFTFRDGSQQTICALGYHHFATRMKSSSSTTTQTKSKPAPLLLGRTSLLYRYVDYHHGFDYTGLSVEVNFNQHDTACTVRVNGTTDCSSCSICHNTNKRKDELLFEDDDSLYSALLWERRISADCTNVPQGRNVHCEAMLPLYFPFDLSQEARQHSLSHHDEHHNNNHHDNKKHKGIQDIPNDNVDLYK